MLKAKTPISNGTKPHHGAEKGLESPIRGSGKVEILNWAFTLVSTFWVASPALFLIGRLLGVWKFQKDILIFSVLMGLCFVVCLIHIGIKILAMKKEDLNEAYLKHVVNKILSERIQR